MKLETKWIKWKECTFSNSLFILINGIPTIECQRHPLSPFIFIIVAEGISSLLSNARANLSFQTFYLEETIDFKHLLFTGHTIILDQASWDNIWSMNVVLQGFKLASGLCANFHKRKIFGFNIDPSFLLVAWAFLSCAISSFPFTFLGIPIGINPCMRSSWDNILPIFVGNSPFGKMNIFLEEVL